LDFQLGNLLCSLKGYIWPWIQPVDVIFTGSAYGWSSFKLWFFVLRAKVISERMNQMAIGRFVILLGVAISLSLVVAGWYAFQQSDDGQPIVGRHFDLKSSDGNWIVTLEELDNGLGFGQGMLYDEVHIRRPNETIASHGNGSESAVSYIDSMGNPGDRPSLSWLDATHLVIVYDSNTSVGGGPGKSIISFRGISIEYRAKPQK
jgi:hypothetical protein